MRRFNARTTLGIGSVHVLAIASILSAIGCWHANGVPTTKRQPSSTASAAPAGLLDLDGKPFDLRAVSKGRVHVVVFTRSDCPISNQSAPEVCSLHDTYHPHDVDFYLIYVDPRETPESIRAHLKEYGYQCPALRDPKHSLVAATQATVTPEAVVFDGNWAITYRGRLNNQFEELGKSRDEPTTHELDDAIRATLAGRPVAQPFPKAIGCYIEDLK